MLVSNNNLLNILLPNENKVLKEVLKEADSKTLTSIKSGTTNINDILTNLFSDLKTGNKNKTTIENILKNSNLFKDLGSFTKSITTLLNQIDSNSNLSKYKPFLQNFLKDISTIDDKSLKDLINKSGIFLESKISQQATTTSKLPQNLENILKEIKTLLKSIPTLEAKKVDDLINKILKNNLSNTNTKISNSQNHQELKTVISLLQNLSKGLTDKSLTNLTTLNNSLKNISNEINLVQSKINNQTIQNPKLIENKEITSLKVNEILKELKTEVLLNKNITNKNSLIKQINTLLQSNNIFSKNQTILEPKSILNQLTNSNEIKVATTQNNSINTLVSNLKNLSQQITSLENKILSNPNITEEKAQLTKNITEILNTLKTELSTIKNIDTKITNQVIDKLLNLQNNFSTNINNLLSNLKNNITNLSTNQNSLSLQETIFKTINKLETVINNFVQNQTPLNDKNLKQNLLQNDIKSTLFQIQEELIGKTDAKSIESFKQIDKMLMQVEYYQLLSITTNSNSVYIPFIWDMLDDGSISMKQINEEKFFCEINLSLKEFGQTQLLLSLYDKNKLDLTVYAQKESFKQAIRQNIYKLKQALNSVDLIPVNIKIIDLKKDEDKIKETKQNNAYSQNMDLGFGINIKA